MTPRRLTGAAILAVLAFLAACADDGPADRGAAALCPTVQAWSDLSVEAVDEFRIASRGLGPSERRERYAEAFEDEEELRQRLLGALDRLDIPPAVRTRLDTALADVDSVVADGAARARDLPESAYDFVAVRDGSLVTGVEKAKAIMFSALAELSDDPQTGVPAGCGRRAALDLSPPATFPP